MRKRPWPRVRSKNPITILRAVIKVIKEEPKRYAQQEIIARRNKPGKGLLMRDANKHEYPPCGTMACVAGWVDLLTSARPDWNRSTERAQRRLGLEGSEADRLFWDHAVPPRFNEYSGEPIRTPRQHARDGINHIKRFAFKKWGVRL